MSATKVYQKETKTCDRCGFVGDDEHFVLLSFDHRGLGVTLCLNCLRAIGKLSRKNERVVCCSCGTIIPKEEAVSFTWSTKSYCHRCYSESIRERVDFFRKKGVGGYAGIILESHNRRE